MKGNAFGDRARLLAEWFQDWNSCEQTIALYSLLSKVSATQARFLSLVLEHSLKNGCDSQELQKLEQQANNSAFLSSLHSQTEADALTQLLAYLPLLHPGNSEARGEYMKLLPKVLLGSSEELDYLDQCRQLLSLALVHPAFPHEDREALTFWLSRLDEKQKNIIDRPQRPPPIPPRNKIYQTKTEDQNCSLKTSNGASRIYINGYFSRLVPAQSEGSLEDSFESFLPDADEEARKCNSLQPGQSLFSPPDQSAPPPGSTSFDEYIRLSKSASLPVHRTPSMSSLLEEQHFEWKAGMKDVPMWLKSLRLHKYQALFAELEYEEMLQMSEEYLEGRLVTKGARNKIILSIRKLARRPETLTEIEQDMEKHGRLLPCIGELHQMLRTPIKPYSPPDQGDGKRKHRHRRGKRVKKGSGDDVAQNEDDSSSGSSSESPSSSPHPQRSSSDNGSDLEELLGKDFPNEDLPSLITRAMGKAYSQLMLHIDTNEDNLSAFIKLLDTAMIHEAFSVDRRKLYFEWKQQCQQTLRVISPKKSPRGRNWGPGCSYTFAGIPSQHPSHGSKSRSMRPLRNPGLSKSGLQLPNSPRSSSTLPRMNTRAPQQSLPAHSAFLRPRSTTITLPSQMSPQAKPFIPSPNGGSAFAPPPIPPRTCEVNETYMDDLCKRVTEHVVDDLSDS